MNFHAITGKTHTERQSCLYNTSTAC